jgi:hypothetical protein
VEALFENLNERGQEPLLERTSGVYEFDIEGSGQWFLKLSKGAVLVQSKTAAQPDYVISCNTAEFIESWRVGATWSPPFCRRGSSALATLRLRWPSVNYCR